MPNYEHQEQLEPEDRPTTPPGIKELEVAMWVAHYATRICTQIVQSYNGKPEASDFMELCSALVELHGNIPCPESSVLEETFQTRAEDLFDLRHPDKREEEEDEPS